MNYRAAVVLRELLPSVSRVRRRISASRSGSQKKMSTNVHQTCTGSTPAARFEELGEDEIVDLILCRLEELERAGCAGPDCLVLASRADLDLERAADLVARGCPPALALRILR